MNTIVAGHWCPRHMKIASLAACFFVLLNGAFSRYIDGTVDYNPLLETIQLQSTLLGYTSFTAIPVKIVNQLMEESGIIPGPLKDKDAPKDKKTGTSSACDFAILSSSVKAGENKVCQRHKAGKEFSWCPAAPVVNLVRAVRSATGVPLNGGIVVFMVLLMLLLPRSSTEEPLIRSTIHVKREAQPVVRPVELFLVLGGK